MPIRRQEVARHILIPDTNILWCADKSQSVSPAFTEFLEANAGEYDIDLVVPDVVLGELQFQQTTSALKSLQKANSEFKKMSAVAQKSYTHRVSERRVRQDVDIKLQGWIQQVRCTIHKTPVSSIDWNATINDAIWRNPPFVEDKNTEKGFRDALIVETVASVVDDNPSTDVAFISADGLVRKAAAKKIGNRCTCYETLEEFESFLKLTNEQLTNDFVRAIQVRAREKFHTEKDVNCLLYRDQLVAKIRSDFQDVFTAPKPPAGASLFGSILAPTNRWEPATQESVWITAPQFVSLENQNVFRWRSKIIFVQLFSYSGTTSGSLLTEQVSPGDQKLRKLEFPVVWVSKVATNGRFMSLNFEKFENVETVFAQITHAEREHYGIPTPETESP